MQTTLSGKARAPKRGVSNTAKGNRDRRSLDAFVGTWAMEGKQYNNVFGGPAKVTAEESFEWLPGHTFLIHRMTGRLGRSAMASIEVIDAENVPSGYRMHTFYNDGRSQDWVLTQNEDNWTISADWPGLDSSEHTVRCTMRFENGGKTRNARWEVSTDGTWKTFWELTSEKKRR